MRASEESWLAKAALNVRWWLGQVEGRKMQFWLH
jgi:hypothetical protein